MVTITAVPCVIYLIFPLIIKAQGTAYIKVDYLAILVFFLLGCVYISIGMFVSSLTESVIIGSCGVVDAGRTCSLEYDEKCCDQRGTGADRTGRNTDYLLCKENSV